jgi:hypothetical protein
MTLMSNMPHVNAEQSSDINVSQPVRSLAQDIVDRAF